MISNDSIPPPPEKPEPDEWCGSGCVPCIYDYYYKNLAEWEDKYGSVSQKLGNQGNRHNNQQP